MSIDFKETSFSESKMVSLIFQMAFGINYEEFRKLTTANRWQMVFLESSCRLRE
jgi:hypothetical protein